MKTLEQRRKELADHMESKGIVRFGVTTGPNWTNLSEEERMDQLEQLFGGDLLENAMPVRNLDGPPWFPMPRIELDDMLAKNWKWYRYKVLDKLHNYAWRFDQWYQRIEWKIKRKVDRAR